jgi:hypothetical protein
MSSTILEEIRFRHEFVELFEKGITEELDQVPNGVSN